MTIQIISFILAACLLVLFISRIRTGYDKKSTWMLFSFSVLITLLVVATSLVFNWFTTILLAVLITALTSILLLPRLRKEEHEQEESLLFDEEEPQPLAFEKNPQDKWEELEVRQFGDEVGELEEYGVEKLDGTDEESDQNTFEYDKTDDEAAAMVEVEGRTEAKSIVEKDPLNIKESSSTEEEEIESKSTSSDQVDIDFEDELLANRKKSVDNEDSTYPENQPIKEGTPERNFDELLELEDEEIDSYKEERKTERRAIDIDMDDFEIPEMDLEEDSKR